VIAFQRRNSVTGRDGTILVDFHRRGDAVALNIKDRETEQLAVEVAALAGESKTRAVKVALQERRARLAVRGRAHDRHTDLVHFLETEVWPQVPRKTLGRRTSKQEREQILGLGPQGV
jgi:antitoxin VapB